MWTTFKLKILSLHLISQPKILAQLQNISMIDAVYLIPEIYLVVMTCAALIIVGTSNFAPAAHHIMEKKKVTLCLYNMARLSLLIAVGFTLLQMLFFLETPAILFNAYVIVDLYTQTLKVVIFLTVWVILTASRHYLVNHPHPLMEHPILILFITLFLAVLVSSYNLMTVFFGIIGFSLNLYVLLLSDAFNQTSREAGIKYYFLSTVGSGLILSGITFAYLIFHNLSFISMAWHLHNLSEIAHLKNPFLQGMLYCIVFGFLFKLAAFPCHLWTPEVYDGSPHPMTALLILPVKIATFGIFLRLLSYTFIDLYSMWNYVIWFSAFFSMLWGGLAAIAEKTIKRFIAYSSINQMGFLLMGLTSGTAAGVRATLMYLLLYVLMNLALFLLLLNTREKRTNRALTFLDELNDYAQDNHLFSITLVIILFSMAGIPPLGGFFGKYFLFLHCFERGSYALLVVGMVTSLMATFYYLRLIKIMWFEKPIGDRFYFETTFTESLFAIYIGLEFILVWFIIWSPWLLRYLNLMTNVCLFPLTSSIHLPD